MASAGDAHTASFEAGGIVEVDGSAMEGGGQVLRCSTALAAVTGRPLRISCVRGKRSKPGLASQHLHGLRLVASIAGAQVEGDFLRSTEVTLEPRGTGPGAGTYEAVLDTPGSVALVLQAALPCAALAGHRVSIAVTGGTDVPFSPPMDFVLHVLEPTLRRCRVGVSHSLQRRGYMPSGGGQVVARVEAREGPLPALQLAERGRVERVHVVVTGAGAFAGDFVGAATAHTLTQLRERLGLGPVAEDTTETRVPPGQGHGASVLAIARTATGALLSGGVRVEGRTSSRGAAQRAAVEAVAALERELAHGGTVDEHLQDQLIVYMAIAAGQSRMRTGPLSMHTCTAMSVASSVCGAAFRVRAVGEDGQVAREAASLGQVRRDPGAFARGRWVVECDGIGLEPPRGTTT